MAIRLLIADDHEVVRAGLRSLLAGTDVEIVGEAENGGQAVQLALTHRPDVVMLDVRMPHGNGLDCLAQFKIELAGIPVLMFSSYENPTYIARAVALGAVGYLSKRAGREEIVEAIRTAARGETIWSQDELRRVTGALAAPTTMSETNPSFTKREGEVLKQLALGLSNKEIAQSLGIGYETVKGHVQHILRKLGVSDRTQAAVWAVKKDLV